MTAPNQLLLVRRKLHDAIADLIDPRPEHTHGHTFWLDSRYHELREALTSQRVGTRNKPGSRPPAWVDAIDLLTKIDRRSQELEPNGIPDQCGEFPAVQRFRWLVAHKWRPQDVEQIITITVDIESFTKDIDRLFAPAPKYLPDKCPQCGQNKGRRQVDGETVRVPALQITDEGCTCNNCRESWPPEKLVWLGRLLGYRIEGVIEI